MHIFLLMLAWASPGALAAAPPPPPSPPCVATAPQAPAEPPAWLLLSCAVVLAGAGRLAAR